MNAKPLRRRIALILLLAIWPVLSGTADLRASGTPAEKASSGREGIESQWGGQIKVQGSLARTEEETVFQPVGTGTRYDGNIQGRLKNRLFLGNRGRLDTHYEIVLSGGDTRGTVHELEALFPRLSGDGLLFSAPVEDDRRFLDLTKTIHETDHEILYHRLDRLALTLLPEWGVFRIGRQAVTWGNGLLFNPMDLFNPFSPTDIERDYKVGDDMVSLGFPSREIGDFHFLYVPRRDPSSGDTAWNESSLGGKLHFARGTTEFDIMVARHFDDLVAGLGLIGYLGDTAWRLDATWTLHDAGDKDTDYLSLVANLDYSWVWREKNFYGYLEFFFSGLGKDEYTEALADPHVRARLDRGDLFVLGRTYLSGHIQAELHPLFSIFLTVINNLADPSGILQPGAVWNARQELQVTIGATLSYGRGGTEFGGFRIPGTPFSTDPANRAYLWLTCFF